MEEIKTVPTGNAQFQHILAQQLQAFGANLIKRIGEMIDDKMAEKKPAKEPEKKSK